jgi:5,5'-dehydrodivanillate O-demethylase
MGPIHAIKLTPQFDCNWLQILENHVDQSHPPILHQDTEGGAKAVNTTRGRIDEVTEMEYLETPWGIRRRQERKGWADLDLIAFPCTQRIFNDFSIKVPIDDTHTRQYSIYTEMPLDGSDKADRASTHAIEYYLESPGDGKTPSDAIHPFARYRMDLLRFQDVMALETQGPIADRTVERLATADRGVVLLREMLKREIEKVQRGLDPLGVVREPGEEVIDTLFPRYVELVEKGEIRPPVYRTGGTRLYSSEPGLNPRSEWLG